ncbi:hypothetical protein [Amycolatopsis sp. NPDC059021]|uniref:hypothetical protein n=1 Tax=Amycolatopsis sp. NPDC059021 TaxID=3346704 RepID=UPI00366D0876
MAHFGLTWADLHTLRLDEFNALVSAMDKDMKASNRQGGGHGPGTRRTPVMT